MRQLGSPGVLRMSQTVKTVLVFVLLGVAIAIGCVAFYRRNLTRDERPVVAVGAFLITGIAGLILPDLLGVKLTGKKKWITVTATAGVTSAVTLGVSFAADPTMKVNVRFSAPVAAGVVDGEYSLEYLRANLRSGRLDQGGSNAIIDDLPAGAENLEVTRYTHGRFDLAKPRDGTKWVYPIENGEVVIELIDRLAPPEPPSLETLLAAIADRKLAEADILKPTMKGDERKKVSLTVENLSGKSFKLWLCDLSQCYAKDTGLTLNPPYADYDVTDKDSEKKFNTFTQFANESGWFALFIGYTKADGTKDRQFIGVYNLFDPMDRHLRIGRGQAPVQFTAEFIR